jgi:hypothetical protein
MALNSPRLDVRSTYRRAPLEWANVDDWRGLIEWVRDIATILNTVLQGKMNITDTLTLTASAGSTKITDTRIGADTVIILTPTTANAAAAFATTFQTYPNATKNEAVINHASNSETDRTFVTTIIA